MEAIKGNKQQRNIPVEIENKLNQGLIYPSIKSVGVVVILPEMSEPIISPKKKVTIKLEYVKILEYISFEKSFFASYCLNVNAHPLNIIPINKRTNGIDKEFAIWL